VIAPAAQSPNRQIFRDLKEDQWITLSLWSLPYLWVHYQVFLSINYCGVKEDDFSLYSFWLESAEFQILSKDPINGLAKLSNSFDQNGVFDLLVTVKSRNFNQEYLLIHRFMPHSLQEWHDINNLPDSLVEEYQSKLGETNDPDWT
jgi:hypothetical protein